MDLQDPDRATGLGAKRCLSMSRAEPKASGDGLRDAPPLAALACVMCDGCSDAHAKGLCPCYAASWRRLPPLDASCGPQPGSAAFGPPAGSATPAPSVDLFQLAPLGAFCRPQLGSTAFGPQALSRPPLALSPLAPLQFGSDAGNASPAAGAPLPGPEQLRSALMGLAVSPLPGPLALEPLAPLQFGDDPESADASPAAGAPAAHVLPEPGQLQSALMGFGTWAPSHSPWTPSRSTRANSHEGSPAPQGPLLHKIDIALRSPAFAASAEADDDDEAVEYEVEALRIEMKCQEGLTDEQELAPGAHFHYSAETDLQLLRVQLSQDKLEADDFADVSSAAAKGSATRRAGGISERDRAAQQESELQTSYHEFRCGCSRTTGQSCLELLSRHDLRAIYSHMYPLSADGTGAEVSVLQTQLKLLKLMWDMRMKKQAPKDKTAKQRHTFYIPHWKLRAISGATIEVCRAAWKKAVGGSDYAHRMMYALVMAGHSPDSYASERKGKCKLHSIVSQLSTAEVGEQARKHGFAVNWWKDQLRVMCFMPNERKILIRGPSYTFYHENIYGPLASSLGLKLQKTAWKGCLPEALKQLAADMPGDADDPQPLKVSRCAKHSRFPECATCVAKREAYLAACRNPGTAPEVGTPPLMTSSSCGL